MSIAMPAIAEPPPADVPPVSAAELAARIPVPCDSPHATTGSDPAPVALGLQPVGHLPRGVPAEIHLWPA